ncbi:MAG: AsmA-like C-terminal domain-containing protein, partial [Magnetococcales bacterium]|nr:AsmA-like C-terminal domain-containing protein [Magnetococcales bacterium]
NGFIHRFQTLSKVLGLLSLPDLPKLLIGDRPDLEGEGFFYKRFQGFFSVEKSVLRAERFQLEGPSMEVILSGTLDFPGNKVDALVGVRPLQTLDQILRGVPLLGKLVGGSREALFETTFDVVGALAEPKVRIRPVDSLAPGILRDIFNVPAEIVNRSKAFFDSLDTDDESEETLEEEAGDGSSK